MHYSILFPTVAVILKTVLHPLLRPLKTLNFFVVACKIKTELRKPSSNFSVGRGTMMSQRLHSATFQKAGIFFRCKSQTSRQISKTALVYTSVASHPAMIIELLACYRPIIQDPSPLIRLVLMLLRYWYLKYYTRKNSDWYPAESMPIDSTSFSKPGC
jgi:hypothetical protein